MDGYRISKTGRTNPLEGEGGSQPIIFLKTNGTWRHYFILCFRFVIHKLQLKISVNKHHHCMKMKKFGSRRVRVPYAFP